jgi:multimeric flavodoxin WrbA
VKVVAIQGSAHRGNTYDRVEQFGEELTALGGVEFEHVPLAELDLEPCRGCFLCFTRGESVCPIRDDLTDVRTKLDQADAAVFATPVYSMHVSYLMKRFVDRLAATFHRPRYFGKYAVGMAVTGGIGLKDALAYVKMFAGTWGYEYVGDLKYIDPPRGTAMPRFMEERDRTPEMARRLYELVTAKPPRKLGFNDYLMFHMMREVYNRSEAFLPTDHAYWKERGWLDRRASYFTGHVRGNLLFVGGARIMARMMGRKMDAAGAGRADSPVPKEAEEDDQSRGGTR